MTTCTAAASDDNGDVMPLYIAAKGHEKKR